MERIVVFTDGAARRNPGPGGWGAIILVPRGEVVELGGGEPHTTNNRMEMTGALEALRHLRQQEGKVDVFTDSAYLVRGMTEWIRSWRRRGWKTIEGADVLNRDLWENLVAVAAERGDGSEVAWHRIPGHAGIPGNERADEIATGMADRAPVGLYRGPARDYDVPLEITSSISVTGGSPPPRRAKGKSKAYSYVSVVDGRPMSHATWAECEQRVKGKSGARYKKTTSPTDEAAILEAWGFNVDDLARGQ